MNGDQLLGYNCAVHYLCIATCTTGAPVTPEPGSAVIMACTW
jgi:hypothetical protein